MPFEFLKRKPEVLASPAHAVDIVIRFMKLENKSAVRALDELEKSATFPVEVDYSKSLEQLISEGNYDKVAKWVNNDNFPSGGKGKIWIPVKLVHFTDDARDNIDVLASLGLVPVDAHSVVSLGNQYPDLQKQYIIAAYGQTYGFDKNIVILSVDEEEHNKPKRIIGSLPAWGGWSGEKCVFAVRPTWQSVRR